MSMSSLLKFVNRCPLFLKIGKSHHFCPSRTRNNERKDDIFIVAAKNQIKYILCYDFIKLSYNVLFL